LFLSDNLNVLNWLRRQSSHLRGVAPKFNWSYSTGADESLIGLTSCGF
jgi:hypothetical protein